MTSNNYEPRVEFLEKVLKRVFRFPFPNPINPEKNNNGKTIYGNSLRRTNPTIKIHCPFDTTAIVLVSCITDDVNGKHMPHPHRIVRHPDCKNGVCVVNGSIKNGEAVMVFKNIALLRTFREDALEELQKRREFVKTIGAECNLFRGENIEASMFNMHSIRICFQVLLKMGDRYMELEPLISEPLIDPLATNLNILEMCPNEGRINWATKIMLVIKNIKSTERISVIFVDTDSNEFPAVMEETQPFVLSNGFGVLICYTPKILPKDSSMCSEFAVKVRSNTGETLSENMRGFVLRRIEYPDSVYSETEYLKMLKDKNIYSSLIAEIDEIMSVPGDQQYTETAAQEVDNTFNTNYAFYTQNMQIHPDTTVSEDLILNNDYWEKNSNTLQANNVYPTISQMDTIPFHTLPRVNSLIGQDNEQDYFQDNGTNSAIQQDYNSRLEQQNTQDRPLIQPINDMDIIFELLDEHLKDQHQNI